MNVQRDERGQAKQEKEQNSPQEESWGSWGTRHGLLLLCTLCSCPGVFRQGVAVEKRSHMVPRSLFLFLLDPVLD